MITCTSTFDPSPPIDHDDRHAIDEEDHDDDHRGRRPRTTPSSRQDASGRTLIDEELMPTPCRIEAPSSSNPGQRPHPYPAQPSSGRTWTTVLEVIMASRKDDPRPTGPSISSMFKDTSSRPTRAVTTTFTFDTSASIDRDDRHAIEDEETDRHEGHPTRPPESGRSFRQDAPRSDHDQRASPTSWAPLFVSPCLPHGAREAVPDASPPSRSIRRHEPSTARHDPPPRTHARRSTRRPLSPRRPRRAGPSRSDLQPTIRPRRDDPHPTDPMHPDAHRRATPTTSIAA